MKKTYYMLFVVLMGLVTFGTKGYAASVDTNRVKTAGWNFFRTVSQGVSRAEAPRIVYVETVSIGAAVDGEDRGEDERQSGRSRYNGAVRTLNCFYVLQFEPEGWVIMSADDRVEPLLAYSLTGQYDTTNMPPAKKEILNGYRDEIAYILQSNVPEGETGMRWQSFVEGTYHPQSRSAVAPLLTTQWNQQPYYNLLCPADANNPYSGHSVTGCAATAMAQVVRYWQWPNEGINQHSYVSNYGTLSVDFGSTTYDYNNMPDKLTAGSSSVQINAVATLMYHCGVSLNMDYGTNESSASLADIPNALERYFAYPDGGVLVSKSDYSDSDWSALIKNELDHSRPVLYAANQASGGGHAFVCDGYDANGLFHMNWGWGGIDDEYYSLTSLYTPHAGYNFTQNHIIIKELSVEGRFMRCSKDDMVFSALVGGEGDVQILDVRGHSLTGSINVTAGNDFTVSANGTSFSSNITLPAIGGRVFVKYTPTAEIVSTRTLTLTSGSCSESVSLYGTPKVEVCVAPKNLTGVHTGTVVNLSWNVPLTYSANSPNSAVVSWDSSVVESYASQGGNASLCMLQRFVPSDLSSYNQYLLNICYVYNYFHYYPRTTGRKSDCTYV